MMAHGDKLRLIHIYLAVCYILVVNSFVLTQHSVWHMSGWCPGRYTELNGALELSEVKTSALEGRRWKFNKQTSALIP